jgi:phage gpG-like protein
MDNVEELKIFIDKAFSNMRVRTLKIVEIEAIKSIKKNFEVGGRPTPWAKSKKNKKHKGTKTLVISGQLSNVSATKDVSEGSVTLSTSPLSRAYARIHQEGGTINFPARMLRFRKKTYKDKTSRIIFAGAKHKRIIKQTMGKAHTVIMKARPYMIIPNEDIVKWIKIIEG